MYLNEPNTQQILKALSNPIRAQIISLLATGPKYQSELQQLLNISSGGLSINVATLQSAGLVRVIAQTGKRKAHQIVLTTTDITISFVHPSTEG
jgi:predicted transcriptional regulator